ncbi:sensor histidine kinase [Natronoflexus pectinivorans]|uniref:histidine kinase n=1 Tax=Natronoflexus pectinivorans TaxID=682526 RepID=A0A4R2GP76_9BACT|nr:ATP-binding protein [Natronoflexus pectinivorans]TCO10828.1 two-component system OmpR family sensor kinase/two-component system phosphate regulon sensor histidine kinase PhoR [Natronoflexus pectinivorans]
MIAKTSYRRKLFIYFLMVFLVFSSVIAIFQYHREKQYRIHELKSILETYSDIVNSYIVYNNIYSTGSFEYLDSIKKIFPRDDIRITVIDFNGKVLYDSFFKNYHELANHINRPEVQNALFYNRGSDIRLSSSTNQDFYYLAKRYDKYFVRSAVVYSLGIKEFLSVENLFWYFIALLFLLTSSVLLFVSDTVGKSILKLKDFAIRAANNEPIDSPSKFPENELGVIGEQIVNIYNNLHKTNNELAAEREKLIQHIQVSKVGIALFSSNSKRIFANNFFVQYLSVISDTHMVNADSFLEIKEFAPIREFIDFHSSYSISFKSLPVKRLAIHANARFFEAQCIIFQDKSYEVSITDVTRSIKEKILKQEMTSNIAHELRTPVSSIKGYLETILTHKDVKPEKVIYFVEKAAGQIERLSQLIRDISMLTKIEEASGYYKMEKTELRGVIDEVTENLQSQISVFDAEVEINIKSDTFVNGNRELLLSIFQNLIENSLKYGGENVKIHINEFLNEEGKVFISFSDNGPGIDEEHLGRIFERFYRVEKGRARENGGTGLGLAIVKNAIELHGSEIVVKRPKSGGVEFIFSLTLES